MMLLGVINFKMREKILFLNGFFYLYELQLQTEKRETKFFYTLVYSPLSTTTNQEAETPYRSLT